MLEFLPQTVKVATGTTVTWEIAGPEPHSVTFVPPGTAPPSVDKDPSLFTPTPATGPYDGTTMANSGVLPLGETSEVQKFSMSFASPGKYTYYCVLHPDMVGTLQVTSGTQDSQQKITKAGNAETKKYLAEGEAASGSCWRRSRNRPRTPMARPRTTWSWARPPPTPTCSRSADAEEREGGRPRHVREQLAGAAHRQLRRPARAHGADRAERHERGPRPVAPDARPGRVPQHRLAATQDQTGARRSPRAATRTTCRRPASTPTSACSHLPSGMAGEIDAT